MHCVRVFNCTAGLRARRGSLAAPRVSTRTLVAALTDQLTSTGGDDWQFVWLETAYPGVQCTRTGIYGKGAIRYARDYDTYRPVPGYRRTMCGAA